MAKKTSAEIPLKVTEVKASAQASVKLISVPALCGKHLAAETAAPGHRQFLMRVCGLIKRTSIVAGSRGYGVRLYGEFFVHGPVAEMPVAYSRIAFLPEPATGQAVKACRARAIESQCIELDCDVWAISDPAENLGYRLIALGRVAPPPDQLQTVLARSFEREPFDPESETHAQS